MKKYLTHIISIAFLIYINILFYVIGNEFLFNGKEYLLIPLIIVEIIFVGGIIAEIVYYCIKVSKNKELKSNPIYYLLIYFFNIFYIPCLNIKHIEKDPKYKKKNIIFIVIMILLYVVLMINMISFTLKSSINTYKSNDEKVTVTLSNDYEKKIVGEFDLYFSSSSVNVGLLLYKDEGYSAKDILDFQTNFVYETRDNVKKISESKKTIDDREINTVISSGYNNGVENTYMMSTITLSNLDNYVIYVIEITTSDNYSSNKKEMQKILENIVINS